MRVPSRPAPPTANVLTAPFEAKLSESIQIYDNTLREGEQPPGVVFTPEEKWEIAQALDAFGVPWANVGFPAASREEHETVKRIAKAGLRMKTAALCRLVEKDIDVTVDSGVQLVALFAGSSDSHLFDKHRWTEAEALSRIEAAVHHAKGRGVLVSFGAEDGSRTPLPRLVKMCQVAADAGADVIVFCDTVGVLTPRSAYAVTSILDALLDKAAIGTHFHDDLGLALANTLAAAEAGARFLQVTVNGAGERAGNTCLEELAMVLRLKFGLDLGLALDRLQALTGLVHRASGTCPSEHKSITGRWCFTHESGIHVAGVLANPETYQPFPPEMIGRHHEIVFGKHSGAQAVGYAADHLGCALSESGRRTVLERIKSFAEKKDAKLTEELVLDWIRAEAQR